MMKEFNQDAEEKEHEATEEERTRMKRRQSKRSHPKSPLNRRRRRWMHTC